jgi:hypothetical protein
MPTTTDGFSACQAGIALLDCFGKGLEHWPTKDLPPFKYEGETLWTMAPQSMLVRLKANFIAMIQVCVLLIENVALAKQKDDPKSAALVRHSNRLKAWIKAGNYDHWRIKFSVDRPFQFSADRPLTKLGTQYPASVRNLCTVCEKPASYGNFKCQNPEF